MSVSNMLLLQGNIGPFGEQAGKEETRIACRPGKVGG